MNERLSVLSTTSQISEGASSLEINSSPRLDPISSLAAAILIQSQEELLSQISTERCFPLSSSEMTPLRGSRRSLETEAEEPPRKHACEGLVERVDVQMEQSLEERYREALRPGAGRLILEFTPFSDWQEKGFVLGCPEEGIDHDFRIQFLRDLADWEDFGLKNSFYVSLSQMNKMDLGNIHALMTIGIIHSDCIIQDKIDCLKEKIESAYGSLIPELNAIPFLDYERVIFDEDKKECVKRLEHIKSLSVPERIKLLQNQAFIRPFVCFFRILAAAQILRWENERESYEELLEQNRLLVCENLRSIQGELQAVPEELLDEEMKNVLKFISIALENCSSFELFGVDTPEEYDINLMKETIDDYVFNSSDKNRSCLVQIWEIFDRNKLERIKFWDSTLESSIRSELIAEKKARLRDRALAYECSELESDLYALADALDKKICLLSVSDEEFFVLPSKECSCDEDRPVDFYVFHHFTEDFHPHVEPLEIGGEVFSSLKKVNEAYCVGLLAPGRLDSFNLLIPSTVNGFSKEV